MHPLPNLNILPTPGVAVKSNLNFFVQPFSTKLSQVQASLNLNLDDILYV